MENSNVSRREFNKLTAAAFGGMVAGTTAGAFSALADDQKKDDKDKEKEVHVCRGLNSCKEQDPTGKNACAGQGACATAKAHECAGMNACKGQGGCGEKPGENKCKEMGKCAVPLKDKTWKVARARFEERMKKEKKPFGPAPKKPEKKKG
ncbi:MAG: hypothetical protein WD049_08810 [Candidatus Paceibacterota bacterium]